METYPHNFSLAVYCCLIDEGSDLGRTGGVYAYGLLFEVGRDIIARFNGLVNFEENYAIL